MRWPEAAAEDDRRDTGLPRMRVLSNRKLKELGRIPRSHEGHQEDALAAVERCGADLGNRPKAVIFFYSHRWARGNWCEELQRELPWGSEEYKRAVAEGKLVGDPDDAAHSKARALAAFGEWFREGLAKDALPGRVVAELSRGANIEIFWWIDWCCTDQDKLLPKKSANEPGRDARPDIAALPAYAAASAGIVAAWTPEYASRPWCRAELLLAYAFMTTGRNVLVVPAGFAGSRMRGMDRYGIVLADPRETVDTLTNRNDRPVIASLTEVAERSTAFSCWRVWVKRSTQAVWMCCGVKVCWRCQGCGLYAWLESRNVQPGKATMHVWVPWQQIPDYLLRFAGRSGVGAGTRIRENGDQVSFLHGMKTLCSCCFWNVCCCCQCCGLLALFSFGETLPSYDHVGHVYGDPGMVAECPVLCLCCVWLARCPCFEGTLPSPVPLGPESPEEQAMAKSPEEQAMER
mmetsp:Transcript_10324/g.27138  ORF Transcript_10324/g.27138 Transcript_10324/m.27138 type:complete len:461 (-) Transcript_10324:270-1652(-)